MLNHIDNHKMGHSDLGWLQSTFHFSFAGYYNPDNMNFGVLRVLNDDLIATGTGFGMHPHNNMEIISYVIDGELTHQDNMGNKNTLPRGMVQYMSAGTGVMHSEHNLSEGTARLLQLWIVPSENGLKPNYGDHAFDWDLRVNQWLHMVSSTDGDAPVKIHQDVNIYSLALDKGLSSSFVINPSRQAYLVQIEGQSKINGSDSKPIILQQKDSLEIYEETFTVTATDTSHFLLIEMALT